MTHRETTRHGRTIWFVRTAHGTRIRLRAEYGTEQFATEYAAIAGKVASTRGPVVGTLAWAIAQYRQSSAWRTLSPATRKQREAS